MTDAQTLILTPTARLARSVLRGLAELQVERGLTSWRAPLVLSFSAWLGSLREQWFLDGDEDGVPISAAQALVLWQAVIDRDIFIGEPRVADLAHSAWRLVHEHALPHPAQWDTLWLSEDQRRFRDWAERFERLCREQGLVDEWQFAARLPELIGAGRIAPPGRIELRGFELPMTALQKTIFKALKSVGCVVEDGDGAPTTEARPELLAFSTPDAELKAAARWARTRLEHNAKASIGIVVPDLQGRLERVEGLFRQVFDPPGFALKPSTAPAWHVSLGHPLVRWPLVDDALALLGLTPWRIAQPEAARLLRSPFVAGWPAEAQSRDRLIARLARHSSYWISAGDLMHQANQSDIVTLARKLADWQAVRRKQQEERQQGERLWPSDWARSFQQELSALGFGHGRPLDSREYQVLQRWHELLEEFSALDLVCQQPLSRIAALQRLKDRARTVVFRERNPGAAVEILGVEEALGERFDALWITTLDNEHWPGTVRRDPLVPARLQAELPHASSETSLNRARQELAGLRRVSNQVIGSYAVGEGDQKISRTALLEGPLANAPDSDELDEAIQLEHIADDSQAPALKGEQSPGGTGVLQHQSDCPFKAFAVWRLGAGDNRPPRPGLDARARGSLLHVALDMFWCELPDQSALLALKAAELEARINQAADGAMAEWHQRQRLALSPRGRELETICLKRALKQWLELEKGREPFRISELEAPISLQFGPLRLRGKIDRIDEIDGGGALLIDYKTGKAARNDWAPSDRLANVQMPTYAVSMEPKPVALAFAQLRPESMKFEGLGEVDPGVGGVAVIGQISRKPFKDIESWQSLLRDWQASLEELAGQFVNGRAEVDPRDKQVCRYCHLHSLCRIHERRGGIMDDDDE